jgi:isocitrate lyase
MRKKKWVMRWQASLMPDPSMIPDATVFQHALHHSVPVTKAAAAEQALQQTSSTHKQTETRKKRRKSEEIEMQMPILAEAEDTFGAVDTMEIGLDPSFMSFLQEEENNLAERHTHT